MGYDYDINYKKGKEYIVADALSRRDNPGDLCTISDDQMVKLYSLSGVHAALLDEVNLTWTQDPTLLKLLQDI